MVGDVLHDLLKYVGFGCGHEPWPIPSEQLSYAALPGTAEHVLWQAACEASAQAYEAVVGLVTHMAQVGYGDDIEVWPPEDQQTQPARDFQERFARESTIATTCLADMGLDPAFVRSSGLDVVPFPEPVHALTSVNDISTNY